MSDLSANPNIKPSRYPAFWFRLFEIFPGACVWAALIFPFFLSIHHPLAVTIFILVFDCYWLVMAMNYVYILVRGYRHLQRNEAMDWQAQLDATLTLSQEEREQKQIIDWRDLYHVVIIAAYQESEETVEALIHSVKVASYAPEKIILVLALEEREGASAIRLGESLQQKHGQAFFRFLVTNHPDSIPGEIQAKGANVAWAARRLVEMLRPLNIPFDRVIVSTADADTRFHPHYFQCLSYHYAITPERKQRGFQPVATFFNNIWEAPIYSRLMAFGSTFWQMVEGVREYRLIAFSTHAMSLQTLVDIRFWCTSIVNEDSRQFFRAYFHYNGQFRMVPLFIPIYMDAVHSGSLTATFQSLYKQQRRWAYGVEHFPYIVMESFHRRKIPFMNRFMLIWRAFQGSFSWATASFFMSITGWIPIVLNTPYRSQVAVSNYLQVTKTLLSFTWIGLVLASFLAMRIIPHTHKRTDRRSNLIMTFQWIFVPVTALFFGSLPGLEAITRLMLGRYLGFKVTPKSQTPPATVVPQARQLPS